MDEETKKRHRTKSEWSEICKKYVASGQSISKFCIDEGIAPSTFSKYVPKGKNAPNKTAGREEVGRFCELSLSSSVCEISLELGCGVVFRMSKRQ